LFGEDIMLDAENDRELLNIFWGSLSLAVEQGSDSDFRTAELLSDGFEGKGFGGFGVKKGFGGGRESVNE
jgi:hypothetical protein